MFIDERYGRPLPTGLTAMPQKQALYPTDSYFWEGWEDLVAVAGDRAADLAREHTFVLVRPDAFAARKVEAILDWLPQNGFAIAAALGVTVSRHQVRALWRYQWNTAPRVRKESLTLLLGVAPSLLLVLRSEAARDLPAATRFASLKGTADPQFQRRCDLRARLRSPAHLISYVHAADDAADFVRELAILLSEKGREGLFARLLDDSVEPADALASKIHDAYERIAPRSLDLNEAVERLRANARVQLSQEGDRARVDAVLDQVISQRPADWRAMFQIFDARGMTYDAWDRIAIASHTSDISHEGLAPLVPGVAAIPG